MSAVRRSALVSLGFAAAAVGLGLYAYYGVAEKEVEVEVKAQRDLRLAALALDDERLADGGIRRPAVTFHTLRVEADDGGVELERRDGGWYLVSPVRARADRYTVDNLEGYLRTGSVKELIHEDPSEADLKRYGLSPPRFVVEAEGEAAGQPLKMRIEGGIENTFDGSTYVRRNGERAVFSAEGSLRYSLEKGLFSLRDKHTAGVDEPKLTEVLLSGARTVHLARKDKKWALLVPPADADTQAVTGMLGALRTEVATRFLDEGAAFERPVLTGVFRGEGIPEVKLEFSSPDGGVLLVRRTEGELVSISELPEAPLKTLLGAPGSLLDRSMVKFDRDAVGAVEFSPGKGGATIRVKKLPGPKADGEKWQVEAPRQGPAKTFKVGSLLWSLGSLKAQSPIGASRPDLAAMGLGKDARAARIFDGEGKLLAELKVGGEVPGKPGSLYAEGTAAGLAEVEAGRLIDFPTDVADVLDVGGVVTADAGD